MKVYRHNLQREKYSQLKIGKTFIVWKKMKTISLGTLMFVDYGYTRVKLNISAFNTSFRVVIIKERLWL